MMLIFDFPNRQKKIIRLVARKNKGRQNKNRRDNIPAHNILNSRMGRTMQTIFQIFFIKNAIDRCRCRTKEQETKIVRKFKGNQQKMILCQNGLAEELPLGQNSKGGNGRPRLNEILFYFFQLIRKF